MSPTQSLKLFCRSKAQRDRENGEAPDFTAVREEAARRKAAKEEAQAAQERERELDSI
jgi:hypothetical protein